MYFVVIIAFGLLLADGLPPHGWTLWAFHPANASAFYPACVRMVAVSLAIVFFVGLTAGICNWLALRQNDGTPRGLDRVQNWYTYGNFATLFALGGSVMFQMVVTSWIPFVRTGLGLARWPLAAELVLLAPFMVAVWVAWIVMYPSDRLVRVAAMEQRVLDGVAPRPIWGLVEYLFYKFRHQVLMIAMPMLAVLFVKHFLDEYRLRINAATRIPWATDALLGMTGLCVLLLAPAMVRWIWATRVLPAGDLRDRLERQCRRIGLRYREILVWNSDGLVVNAAVMGFVAPLRYVMLSDGLLETIDPLQIEAVFGHEAGHVRHFHLQYFLVFALFSMLLVGGVLEILVRTVRLDVGALQLIAMAGTFVVWAGGFGWLSRRFERQADVFGVRAVTSEINTCSPQCGVHAPNGATSVPSNGAALCLGAVHLFSNTLLRIADLNGIPREAPSWRHGSINSRCRLLHHLAESPPAAAGFDRRLRHIKTTLVMMTAIGCAIAAWLYWPSEFFNGNHRARPVRFVARSVHRG